MSSQETVTVYNFRFYDPAHKSMTHARWKAEREVIVSRFEGEVLEGTAHAVPREELDDEGLYQRRPTGWGDLQD